MRRFGDYLSNWTLHELLKEGTNGPKILSADLGPGDMILLPVGWWHYIESLEESYSVVFSNTTWPNNFGQPQRIASFATQLDI